MVFPDCFFRKISIKLFTRGNDRPSFENGWRGAPTWWNIFRAKMMIFEAEHISSYDVSYAFRITQGALWRPRELFSMTFWYLEVETLLTENVAEMKLNWCCWLLLWVVWASECPGIFNSNAESALLNKKGRFTNSPGGNLGWRLTACVQF